MPSLAMGIPQIYDIYLCHMMLIWIRPKMDLKHLRYFLAILEMGSLTRAAQHLGVAQPALSIHVKNMEEHLGTPLLLRSKTGVQPTEAGQLLAQRARTLLEDFARTEDDIRTLDGDPMGEVRIGLPGTISNIVALPLIEAARARFPRIQLTIVEAMSGFIADWLAEGRVDLAVLYDGAGRDSTTARCLLEEELVVLWPAGQGAAAEIALADLSEVSMVLPSGSHGLRMLIETALGDLGIRPRIALEIDSYANIKRLVTMGHGASILPRHAVAEEVAAGRMEISRLAAPGFWRSAYLVYPADRPATRAKEAIRALTEEVIADLLAKGIWAGAIAV